MYDKYVSEVMGGLILEFLEIGFKNIGFSGIKCVWLYFKLFCIEF